MYLQYLTDMKALQRQQALELERLQTEDMNQAIQRQLDKWEGERLARERLMAEVIAVRKLQIASKGIIYLVKSEKDECRR